MEASERSRRTRPRRPWPCLAGAGGSLPPFRPEIRGKLLTGGEPLYLSATIVGSEGFNSEVSHVPPWPIDDKIVAEELGPYLAVQDAARG